MVTDPNAIYERLQGSVSNDEDWQSWDDKLRNTPDSESKWKERIWVKRGETYVITDKLRDRSRKKLRGGYSTPKENLSRSLAEISFKNNTEEQIQSVSSLADYRKVSKDIESRVSKFDIPKETQTELLNELEKFAMPFIEDVEALADEIRNPIDLASFENAVEQLRELDPQKLGGFKTSDIMRGRRGLRMFG